MTGAAGVGFRSDAQAWLLVPPVLKLVVPEHKRATRGGRERLMRQGRSWARVGVANSDVGGSRARDGNAGDQICAQRGWDAHRLSGGR
jgi:hypothetical protein